MGKDQEYVVQKGESWESIAGKLGGDQRKFASLRNANGSYDELQQGQVIRIPGWIKGNWSTKPYVSPTTAAYEGMSPSFDEQGQATWDYSQLGPNYRGPMGPAGVASTAYPSITSVASPVSAGYSPSFWEDGKNVNQWYTWMLANPGKPLPGGVDPIKLKAAYDWFSTKNTGKTTDQWGYLAANDPARSFLQQMPLPPAELMTPQQLAQYKRALPQPITDNSWQTRAGGYQTPAQAQAGQAQDLRPGDVGYDWSKVPAWQRTMFDFTSDPAYTPTALGLFAGGVPGAALGYTLGSVGAASQKAKQTGEFDFADISIVKAFVSWMGGDVNKLKTDNPVIMGIGQVADKGLALFNLAIQTEEQVLGTGSQAIQAAQNGTLSEFDWKKAWEAAQLAFEAGGASSPMLANIPPAIEWGLQRIPKIFENADWKNEDLKFADYGQVFQIGKTEPVTVDNNTDYEYSLWQTSRTARLLSAVRDDLMEPGANPEEVIAQWRNTFGITGVTSDLLYQVALDPLNRMGDVESIAGRKIAKMTGQEHLAAAFDKVMFTKNAGIFGAVKELKASGLAGLAATTSPLEKRLAGIAPDNTIAELKPETAATGIFGKVKNAVAELTPQSKAMLFIDKLRDNVGGLLYNTAIKNGILDPGEFGKHYNALADMDYNAGANLGEAYLGSPEAYTIAPAMRAAKDFVGDRVLFWKMLDTPGGPREVLYKVAGILGMTPDEVIQAWRNNDTARLDFDRLVERARAGTDEGAKALAEMADAGSFTPESLQQALQVYEKPGVPHSPQEWFGQVMSGLDDKYQTWIKDYYGLKKESDFFRLAKLGKAIMSMALLNSPTYMINNVLNNAVTTFAENGHIMPDWRVNEWLADFGVTPSRLNEGVGLMGDATGAGGTTGNVQYARANILKEAEKGGGLIGGASNLAEAVKKNKVTGLATGLFPKISGKFEGMQGKQAFVQAMRDHWAQNWKAGRGFAKMDPSLAAAIDAQIPGASKLIYDAIGAGMNIQHLDELLVARTVESNLGGALDQAARDYGIPVEQMTEMFNKTGVLDDLQRRIKNARTPAEKLRAFEATKQHALDYLDQMAANEFETLAKKTAARVKLEGPGTAAEMLAGMQMGLADRWIGTVRTMEEMMSHLGSLPPEQQRAYVMTKRAQDRAAWIRQNNFSRSIFRGVFDAWGVEAGQSRSALNLMLESHTTWDAAFKTREILQDEFFKNLFERKAGPMDWDMVSAKVDIEFEKAFQADLKTQSKLSGQLSDILTTQFGQQAGDVLKAGFKDVGDWRTAMWKAQQEHIAATKVMTKAQRNAAWRQFNEAKVGWINEWKQRYTDAINKAMGFYKGDSGPTDPNAPAPARPGQPELLTQDVAQNVAQAADTHASEILQAAVDHGLTAADANGQPVAPAPEIILDTVKKWAGAESKNVHDFADVTPDLVEKAAQNKETKAAEQQQLDTEIQAQQAEALTPEPTVQYLTSEQIKERQDAVLQVMADNGLPTADAAGEIIPDQKLALLKIVRQFGPGDAHQILRFADITPEMARDALENYARQAPENVENAVRDIWRNDQTEVKPVEITAEQQRQADVFELLQNKPVAQLPAIIREPVRVILGDMLNQVRAGRKMSLIEWIKSKGGINLKYLRDVTGEGKVQRSWGPGLFKTKGGLSLDELAMRMEEEMYMTPGELDNPMDNGGVNRAVELIQKELSGDKAFSTWEEGKSATLPAWYESLKGLKNKQAKVALTIQQMLQGLDNVSGGAEATATERAIKNEIWRQLGDQATYDGNLAQATGHPYGWNEFRLLLEDVQSGIENADADQLASLMDTLDNAYMRAPEDIPAAIDELRQRVYGELVTAKDKTDLLAANDTMGAQLERATDKARLHMSADRLRELLVEKFGYSEQAADNNVALAKARAQTWATLTGNSVDDWFTRSFADVFGKDENLPDGANLEQINPVNRSLNNTEMDGYARALVRAGESDLKRAVLDESNKQARIALLDAAHRLDPSMAEQVARTVGGEALFQALGEKPAGAVQFLADQRAVVKAFESADASTFAHEFGHILRRDLYRTFGETGAEWIKSDIDTLEKHFGVKDGQWETAHEEAFARTWERYLAEGIAPNAGLKSVFEHFRAVMEQVYKMILGSPIDVSMSDEVRGVFDRLISEREAAPVDAGQAGGLLPGMQEITGQLFDVQNAGTRTRMDAPNAKSITDVIPGKNALDAAGNPVKVGDIVVRNGEQYNIKGTNRAGRLVTTDGKVIDPGDVNRVAQQDTFLQTQPGQSEPFPWESAPTMPHGGTEGILGEEPTAQIYHEAFSNDLLPALDALRSAYEGGAGKSFNLGDLSPESLAALQKYLKQVKAQMPGAKLATLRYGEIKRDAALLNYNRRRGAGKVLDFFAPYRFWMTESAGQWFQRAIDKPAWLSNYYRLQQAGKTYQSNEPDRLKGKIRIPIPGMPEWAGDGLYVDPGKTIFPFANFFTPLERLQQEQTGQVRSAEYIIRRWMSDESVKEEDATQAIETHSGTTWERALAQAVKESDAEMANPLDFIGAVLGPAFYLSAPLNALGIAIPGISKGNKDAISPTPAMRTAQNMQSAMDGTPWQGVGDALGLLAKPEEWAREKLGMSKMGKMGDIDLFQYYVDRQLANMVAEGYPLKLAQVATLERQGPMYDEAVKRVQQEQVFKQQGMGSLYFAVRGNINALNPAMLFSGGLLPDGELEIRGDKTAYNDAWDAYKAGDKQALTKFFDDHPEYEARLGLYDKPEERLRQFVISEIWDKYMGLDRYSRKAAGDALGEDFKTSFLDKETRAPENVSMDTLAMWAKLLNGYVPGSEKMPPTGISPETMQTQPAQVPDPAFSAAVSSYYDQRDAKFPNYYDIQNGYYALPEGSTERKAYLLKHPELAKYWDWNREYKRTHPEAQLVSDMSARKVDLTQFNDLLMQQIAWYVTAGVPLTTGGYAELRRVWEKEGRPSGNVKVWLDAVIKPNMLMTQP